MWIMKEWVTRTTWYLVESWTQYRSKGMCSFVGQRLAVRKMKCVATNVPNFKIIRQGVGDIWHQESESPAQNDTHTTKINLYFNNEPPKSCNPLLDWKHLGRAIQQTMSCLQQKILWLYPDQSVDPKRQKSGSAERSWCSNTTSGPNLMSEDLN